MIPRTPIILGIICVSVLFVSIAGMLFFEDSFSDFMNSTPSQNKLKSDSKVLFEINKLGLLYQNTGDQENFEKQQILMRDKIKDVAVSVVGINSINVDLKSHRIPFQDASDLEPSSSSDSESFQICNIPQKIPMHLQKISDTEMFQLFDKKYSQYEIELIIVDERRADSDIHYAFLAKSDDGNHTALTFFDVNSCSDELTNDYDHYISCNYKKHDEQMSSTNHKHVIASLEHENFCTIPLSQIHQSFYDYAKDTLDKMDEMEKRIMDEKLSQNKDEEPISEEFLDAPRLEMLQNLAYGIAFETKDKQDIEKKIQEYNTRFGKLPLELQKLLDARLSAESNIEKKDSKILVEINQNAMIHQKNNDMDKFHEQVSLMEEEIKTIASDSLGMNVSAVFIDMSDHSTGIENVNFPFRDSSEIKPTSQDDKPSFQICNIPEKIPIHLKKIKEKEWFTMFSEKYAKHSTSLDLMDERYTNSLLHYGITVTSQDGLFSASTMFHLNTCTDEVQEDSPFLVCKNNSQNEMHQSWNQEDIIASLHLEEFCTIPLDPWRESLHEYGKKVQEKRLEYFDDSFELETDEEIRIMWDERSRLGNLMAIPSLVINYGLESEITQKKIMEYNEKFGEIPKELQDLVDARPME